MMEKRTAPKNQATSMPLTSWLIPEKTIFRWVSDKGSSNCKKNNVPGKRRAGKTNAIRMPRKYEAINASWNFG